MALQQPEEQLLEMTVGGMKVRFAVDLSGLPVIDNFQSLPIRVTVSSERPFEVRSIGIPESDSGLRKWPREDAIPAMPPLTMHAIISKIQDLSFGQERPSAILIGHDIRHFLDTYKGLGFDGMHINGVPLILDAELPRLVAVFLNFGRIMDRRYNAIMEYTNA